MKKSFVNDDASEQIIGRRRRGQLLFKILCGKMWLVCGWFLPASIQLFGGLIIIDASEQSKIEIDDKAEKTTNS